MERQSESTSRGLLESYLHSVARLANWALPIIASSFLVLWVHQLGHDQQKALDLQGK
jgi:hypothetical protein